MPLNYIQWLFPNSEHSRVTPDAPVLTPEIIQLFKSDDLLESHLLQSFKRILSFFGLERSGGGIQKEANWNDSKQNWFIYDTHNNLRITRILKCLHILGLKNDAKEFYMALTRLRATEQDCGIGDTAFDFWAEGILVHRDNG
ncbi:MAG: hypothetical protein GY746_01185 [Gammaproteobacteria bacterium]|nr:hypothetical protein [Gammaproteobacteria bacterium]